MAVRRSCRRSAPPRPTRHSGGAIPRLAARIKNGAFLEYRKRVDYHIGSIFDIPKTPTFSIPRRRWTKRGTPPSGCFVGQSEALAVSRRVACGKLLILTLNSSDTFKYHAQIK